MNLIRETPEPTPDPLPAGFWRALLRNLGATLRIAAFRRFEASRLDSGAAQLTALLVLSVLFEAAVAALACAPAMQFNPWAIRGLAFDFLLLLAAGVFGARRAGAASALRAWMPLMIGLGLSVCFGPLSLLWTLAYRLVPDIGNTPLPLIVSLVLNAWWLCAALRGLDRLDPQVSAGRGIAGMGFVLVILSAWLIPRQYWFYPDYPQEPRPRLSGEVVSEMVLDLQPRLLASALDALAPQRPGRVDSYFVAFAPYAEEDVFLRESRVIRELMDTRFDTAGRSLLLANNDRSLRELPLATGSNLRRALAAIGQRIDRDEDLVILYLSSHGTASHELLTRYPPLRLGNVRPEMLRAWLDAAGIRFRVLVISACYSGGFVGPLRGTDTLVMTASDAEHTSFGCGSESDFTYFGKAVFDEQLRLTHSFENAFHAALPILRQREAAAGERFSNPQIEVGAGIRAPLARLERRLDRSGQ